MFFACILRASVLHGFFMICHRFLVPLIMSKNDFNVILFAKNKKSHVPKIHRLFIDFEPHVGIMLGEFSHKILYLFDIVFYIDIGMVFNGKLSQNGIQKLLMVPPWRCFLATFFRTSMVGCILFAFGLPFGNVLGPLGSLLPPFGSVWAPLWLLVNSFSHFRHQFELFQNDTKMIPFGSLWLPVGSL